MGALEPGPGEVLGAALRFAASVGGGGGAAEVEPGELEAELLSEPGVSLGLAPAELLGLMVRFCICFETWGQAPSGLCRRGGGGPL